ncbi:hypothetical protein ABTL18_20015, partial [Acinetobacter baumannii]
TGRPAYGASTAKTALATALSPSAVPVLTKTLSPHVHAACADARHEPALPPVQTVPSAEVLVSDILERTPERGGYRSLVAPENQGVD